MSTSFHDNKKTTLGVFNTAAKVYPRGAISIGTVGEARYSPTASQKKTEKGWKRQAQMALYVTFSKVMLIAGLRSVHCGIMAST